METVFNATAFAKINLDLRIGPKADNGYHSILSIFQSVSLGDEICLNVLSDFKNQEAGSGIAIQKDSDILVEGEFDCPPERTTLYKAASIFLRRQGIKTRLHIKVVKGIPAKAGLGGGSADAAAILILLNKAFKTGLDTEELSSIGLSIGSDVPFFLTGGTAFVHGRGERIEPLPPLGKMGILLLCPSFGVSTDWAYTALDSYRAKEPRGRYDAPWDMENIEARKLQITEELKNSPRLWTFQNDFVPLLYNEYPIYQAIEALLRSEGAAFISISGSGSTVFAIFDSLGKAEEVKKSLTIAQQADVSQKLLYGMALHAIKPLETSLRLS